MTILSIKMVPLEITCIFALANIILVTAFIPQIKQLLPTSSVTTPTLAEDHGYFVEKHTVETSDGYILKMHRIPSSPATIENANQRPVVFLLHGLMCSSCAWVISNESLAYVLADAGYDVWMGNARGNRYSKKHSSFLKNPWISSFWDFSWHEIGIYDLPAMINYVRRFTKQESLHYVGYSQGTTALMVLLSMRAEFNLVIKSAHLLAPVVFMDNVSGPLVNLTAKLIGEPNFLLQILSNGQLLPNTILSDILGKTICSKCSPIQELCSNMLFLIGGYDSPHLDKKNLKNIVAVVPAGCSIKQIMHYVQVHMSGSFREFDYGQDENMSKYGKATPPNYKLRNVNVPLYLYYSENDFFSNVTDVLRLVHSLKPGIVKNAYILPFPKFNHLDFVFSEKIKEHLNSIVLEYIMKSELETRK